MSDPNSVAFGVLGMGAPGAVFANEIIDHPQLRLVAGCDPREAALEPLRALDGVAAYTDIDQLIANDEIEAVVIATPTPMHCDHAVRLLRAGKHLLIEKPVAATPAEGRLIAEMARETGRTVVIGVSHSYETPLRAMRALIDSGRFGPLRSINALNYNDWWYRPRHPDELDSNKGGSVAYRQAVHHADILQYLTGGRTPRAVSAQTGSWAPERAGIGSYSALLRYDEALTAYIFYSGYDHFPATELTFGQGEGGAAKETYGSSRRRIEAVTPEEEAQFKYGPPEVSRRGALFVKPQGPVTFGLVIASCEGADIRVGPEGLLVYSTQGRHEVKLDGIAGGRRVVLDELIGGIAGEPLTHDAEWGTRNIELCTAIVESGARGQEVAMSGFVAPFPPAGDRELIEAVTARYDEALAGGDPRLANAG
jgi:phthalate 4,5-cis-dihydrodiol dehydrogenase